MRKNLERLVFLLSAAAIVLGLSFGAGLYSAIKKNFAFQIADSVRTSLKLTFQRFEEAVTDEPTQFLQPARKSGSGVTVNERSDDGLILISGFFDGGVELRLIRRDGTPVARWPARFSQHFPHPAHLEKPPATDLNVDIHGAVIHPDGSVVFSYEYAGTVKLSRCGEVQWTLAHPTHHSLEIAEAGGYWIPGREMQRDPESFPPFTKQSGVAAFEEDLILRVGEDGKIVARKSVPKLLFENGLEPVMTATGYSFRPRGSWEVELVHLNQIGELPRAMAAAFPQFEAGDLVLSLRGYNLLLVVDPDTWKVKWHQTGPWRRQHDPEFAADGTITVFNNNTYRLDLDANSRGRPNTPQVSNILKVDPKTGRAEIAYGGRPGQELLSVIRGKQQPLPGGGFLVTEFEGGRAFEVDAAGRTVWEYINRYDEEQVLEVTEARLYPRSYFTVEDWTCPGGATSASQ